MRLFIGLSVEQAACDALSAAVSAMRSAVPARYVPAELYHITLAYLGERPREALPALCALLNRCAASCAPFSLTVESLGTFGRDTDAILYASLRPETALAALGEQLRAMLRQAGELFDEKPLFPHITLARKAVMPGGAPPIPLSSVQFMVRGLTLYHSARVEGVLRYEPIEFAALALQPRGLRA